MKNIMTVLFLICMSVAALHCSGTTTIENKHGWKSAVGGKEIIPGNSVDESGVSDLSAHSGTFTVTMSGYRGEIFIGVADGKFYGTIKFFNWGNGVPQPLINLKVNDDKIYFKRAIKTREELLKYGGTDFFEQDFYGIFSSDRKTIKGYYRYIGTQDNWEAVRK